MVTPNWPARVLEDIARCWSSLIFLAAAISLRFPHDRPAEKSHTELQLIRVVRLPPRGTERHFGSRRARNRNTARSHRIECRETERFARPNESGKRVLEMSPVIFKTLQQAKRFLRILVGFTLLAIGVVLLVGPGPGWLVILLGLGLLAAEFVWARRLLDSMKEKAVRLRKFVLSRGA